jgi:DnaJ-class molecular chaperone
MSDNLSCMVHSVLGGDVQTERHATVRVMLTPSATTASDSDARRVVPSGTPRLEPGPQGNLAAKIEAEQPSQLASSSVGAVSFGPFRLLPAQRLLLQAGREEG